MADRKQIIICIRGSVYLNIYLGLIDGGEDNADT